MTLQPALAESPTPTRIRLAILDDHEVLLDSLGSWIGANAPDFDVVLSASSWLQLVHSDNFPTDLVFLDFQLREPVSIEARVRTCRASAARGGRHPIAPQTLRGGVAGIDPVRLGPQHP